MTSSSLDTKPCRRPRQCNHNERRVAPTGRISKPRSGEMISALFLNSIVVVVCEHVRVPPRRRAKNTERMLRTSRAAVGLRLVRLLSLTELLQLLRRSAVGASLRDSLAPGGGARVGARRGGAAPRANAKFKVNTCSVDIHLT